MSLTPLEIALSLVAISVLGALLPFARRWGQGGLHVFVAASAGIFLGMVFLHLIPEMAGLELLGHGHAHAHDPDPAHSLLPWGAALLGFGGLYALERLWLRGRMHDPDPHALLWLSTWIGLVVHAVTSGLGLAGVVAAAEDVWVFLLPLLWHKFTESFSLASVLRLGRVRTALAIALLGIFVLLAPAGLLVGDALRGRGWVSAEVLTGFAVGTFLYVALIDLLPEVFHQPGKRGVRVAAVVLGIASAALAPGHLAQGAELAGAYLSATWEVLLAMGPWLVGGFLAAGLLAQVLSPRWLARHLAGEGARPVAIASLVGAPLPLCSCSVLPVAASLRRAGAGRGATSAFLVATPETGLDSLAVTWGLFGPLFALFRALASVGSAFLTGLAVAISARGARPADGGADAAPQAHVHACAEHGDPDPELAHRAAGNGQEHLHAPAAATATGPPVRGFLGRALRYACVEIVDDLAGALALGILLAATIGLVLPEDLLADAALRGPLGLLLALAVAVPLYVCASASTPIAHALVLKGLSPGAALVFLLAGPATNLTSLAVLRRTLGPRASWVHLSTLCAVTLALGLAVDLFLPGLLTVGEGAPGHDHAHVHEHGPLEWIGALALVALLGASGLRRLRGARRDEGVGGAAAAAAVAVTGP